MSSSNEVFGEFIPEGEESAEKILRELLNPKKRAFHTEIPHPVPLATLETVASILKDYDACTIVTTWVKNYKTEMIAYKRQRAKEIIEGVKSLAEREARQRGLREMLVGGH